MTSLEVGMKNHEVVPSELVASIANLRHGGCYKILRELVRHKLIAYDHKNGIKGYHLTYSGYDYLALRSLTHQDAIHSIGNKIGVGKESDIYIAAGEDGTQYVLKLHRLGRVCFRKVKEKRDYLKKRKSAGWLYMSRLAAEREFSFLQALHTRGYPVPEPIACNRHAIVMKLVPGYPLSHVKEITNTAKVRFVIVVVFKNTMHRFMYSKHMYRSLIFSILAFEICNSSRLIELHSILNNI